MNIIKKIKSFLNSSRSTPKTFLPFFTKDIFCDKKFKIGDFTYGNPIILFENEESNLIIGKFCSIADNVTIFLGGNHRTDWITTYPFNALENIFPEASTIKGHPATKGDIIIGNDVWIGRDVVIMSGVSIGDGAVIAAGSVVSKNIGDYEIWGGNPSRMIKKRFTEAIIKELKNLKWWYWEIAIIKERIPFLCSDNLDFLNKLDL
jgi:acetyltransferase-like isoleucine patch superfamily enzyme